MKNLLIIFATIISLNTGAFASNIGDGSLAIINTATVSVTLDNEGQKDFILYSAFEEDKDNIAFEFDSSVSMIQVFNGEGEIEMILPVDSKKVNLGMSLFNTGIYKVGFMVDGISEIQYTSLQLK